MHPESTKRQKLWLNQFGDQHPQSGLLPTWTGTCLLVLFLSSLWFHEGHCCITPHSQSKILCDWDLLREPRVPHCDRCAAAPMSHALWKASGAAHRPTRNSCFSLAFWLSCHDEQWQSLDPPRPIRLDLPYSSFCLGISLPHCPPRRKEWRVLSAAGSLNSSYKLEYLFMSSFLCDIRLLQPSAPPYLLQQTLNHFGV